MELILVLIIWGALFKTRPVRRNHRVFAPNLPEGVICFSDPNGE